MAVFRPFSSSDALRSDRSAGDRQRHREKLREAIRDNIADIISEESIIGRDRDRIIKVPIRGIKEYRFVYGDNQPQAGAGEGGTEPGQVIGKAQKDGDGAGRAGDQPGVDYYETDVTLEELIEIMFEDLELPDMERKILREVMSERIAKRKGYRAGVRVHLDRRRTAVAPAPPQGGDRRRRAGGRGGAGRRGSGTRPRRRCRPPPAGSCASRCPSCAAGGCRPGPCTGSCTCRATRRSPRGRPGRGTRGRRRGDPPAWQSAEMMCSARRVSMVALMPSLRIVSRP